MDQEGLDARTQNILNLFQQNAPVCLSLNMLGMGFVTRGDITTRLNATMTEVIAVKTLVSVPVSLVPLIVYVI